MENYEINILKRNGNWKKYDQEAKPIHSKKNINKKKTILETENSSNENIDFLKSMHQVSLIIDKLEDLENQKTVLRNNLLEYEKIFVSKKNNSEQKLSQISKEVEMIDKTIKVIKNLKEF